METVHGRVAAILEPGNRLSLQTGSRLITLFLDSRTDCISVGGAESKRIAPTSLRLDDELEVSGELSTDNQRMFARSISLKRRVTGQTPTSAIVSYAVPAEGTKREQAHAVLLQGLSEYTQRHDDRALQQSLGTAIHIDPSYPEPYFNLALLAEAHENWPYAATLLLSAIRSSPESSPLHQRAEQHLASVLTIRMSDATPEGRQLGLYASAIARATSFLESGLLQLAVSEAAVAIKIDPDRWEAYAVAANALSRDKEMEESRKFLDLALQHAPYSIHNDLQAQVNQSGETP